MAVSIDVETHFIQLASIASFHTDLQCSEINSEAAMALESLS